MSSSVNTIVSEQLFKSFADQLQPYFSFVGICESVIDDPSIEMPEDKFIELLEVAAKHGDNDLGLKMGSNTVSEHIGALGHAIVNSPSLLDGINVLIDFVVTYSHYSNIQSVEKDDSIELYYQITDPTILSKRQDAEYAVSAIYHMLIVCAEQKFPLQRVEFEHPAPGSTDRHKQIFNCPLKFGRSTNKLVFKKDFLTLRSSSADNRLFKILISHLENQKKLREPDELKTQLTCLIASQLHLADVSIQKISNMMNISVRTLQRRLAKENLDFSLILNDIRHQLALNYITDTNYSILQIAEKLGYQETSSFSRAFKRWTDFTPKEYRQIQLN